MKVRELITELLQLPQDMTVVTAGDDEGNSFRLVPYGWVSVEKFDSDMSIIAEEDYDEDDLTKYVCIG